MIKNKALYASKTDSWGTPEKLYQELNKIYKFKLDPCCDELNKKHDKNYFTKKDNGLIQDWSKYKSVFMNPPYGREIKSWVKKAYEENKKGCLVVCLLPARTDTKWFHDYIYKKHRIDFIKGRLRFGNAIENAPFPSMIVYMEV